MPYKHILLSVAMMALPILVLILLFGSVFSLYMANACVTEVRQRIVSTHGLGFEISETDCSTLGEDASISVHGLDEHGRHATLLFRYGPGPDVLPTIQMPDQGRIVITISSVSDVVFQKHRWMNRSVYYDIGHIDYPRPGADDAR
jgi:hypothetical protein